MNTAKFPDDLLREWEEEVVKTLLLIYLVQLLNH